MVLKIFAGFTAAVLALLGAGLLFLFQGGIATVYVEDSELSFWVPVPVNALLLGVHFIPDDELAKARVDLVPYRDLISAALQELEDCPDSVFVDVDSGTDHVQVRKQDDNLIVDVDSDGEKVFIKVPLRSVKKLFVSVAT